MENNRKVYNKPKLSAYGDLKKMTREGGNEDSDSPQGGFPE